MWELTTNEVALIELEKSLSMKKNNRHHIQCTSTSVGGDFNLPGCYWKNQVVKPLVILHYTISLATYWMIVV